MSCFGRLVSVGLSTDYGKFTIHVLPEKIVLGTHEGRSAATFIEHYAMVPADFDASRTATLYTHNQDAVGDLFSDDTGGCKLILKRLGGGENGILLCVAALPEAKLAALREGVDRPVNASPLAVDDVVSAFIANTVTPAKTGVPWSCSEINGTPAFAGVTSTNIILATQELASKPCEGRSEPDFGVAACQLLNCEGYSAFHLHERAEIIRLSIPAEAQRQLFPEDPQTVFFKHLTHYALVTKNNRCSSEGIGGAGGKPSPPVSSTGQALGGRVGWGVVKQAQNSEVGTKLYHPPPNPPPKGGGLSSCPPLVRVHSSCTTGDIIGSRECDCGAQLRHAMAQVAEQGGAVLYHDAEGRGIHSLAIKMLQYKAKATGLDTYAAMEAQGYPQDARGYGIIGDFLRDLGLSRITLLTNNPTKRRMLEAVGIDVAATSRIRLPSIPPEAVNYLRAKREIGGHEIGNMWDEQEF